MGRVLRAARPHQGRRHRRGGLRPLPPLSRGHRADGRRPDEDLAGHRAVEVDAAQHPPERDHRAANGECAAGGGDDGTGAHGRRHAGAPGPGAGGDATGSAMVGDIIDAIRNIKYAARGRVGCTCMRDLTVLPMESLLSQNCVRVLALDVPGVLGKIASEFGNSGVSLSAVKQPISTPGKLTNIYFLTHRIQERNIQNAIKSIQKLDVVKDVYAIRVEDGES